MPFTLAHPAAALPFLAWLRRPGLVAAFVIGSMCPDLPYFLPIGLSGVHTHRLAGLLWFCLPAGLITCQIYGALLRPFFLAMSPPALAHRVDPSPRAGAWAAIAACVLAGAATHVCWDSFTHGTGAMVQAFPSLRIPVPVSSGYAPPLFKLLQHGSTLLGFSALAVHATAWYRRTTPAPADSESPRLRWLVLMLLVVPTMAVGLGVLIPALSAGSIEWGAGRAVTSAGTVFLFTLMASALCWRALRGADQGSSSRT